MKQVQKQYYEKRANILVKNLKSRHFDAYYCATKEDALAKALELIPEGATVGWGGVMSAHEIGLIKALNEGNYNAIDRDSLPPEQRAEAAQKSAGRMPPVFLESFAMPDSFSRHVRR